MFDALPQFDEPQTLNDKDTDKYFSTCAHSNIKTPLTWRGEGKSVQTRSASRAHAAGLYVLSRFWIRFKMA